MRGGVAQIFLRETEPLWSPVITPLDWESGQRETWLLMHDCGRLALVIKKWRLKSPLFFSVSVFGSFGQMIDVSASRFIDLLDANYSIVDHVDVSILIGEEVWLLLKYVSNCYCGIVTFGFCSKQFTIFHHSTNPQSQLSFFPTPLEQTDQMFEKNPL